MSDITGVAGILIYTGNFERMSAFYRETLGLPMRTQKPAFVSFEWGEFRITVTEHSQVNGSAQDTLRIMVNFTVDDIEAVTARLESEGVHFTRRPYQETWGGWIATFEDPDGNTLQLFQLPG